MTIDPYICSSRSSNRRIATSRQRHLNYTKKLYDIQIHDYERVTVMLSKSLCTVPIPMAVARILQGDSPPGSVI